MDKKKTKEKFRRVIKTSKIKKGEGTSVRLGDLRLAIFNVGGSFFVIDDACPHRGAPLGDGPLRGSVVTCTWHGWEFDVKKGCHVLDPDIDLKKYPTKIKNQFLYVGLPE